MAQFYSRSYLIKLSQFKHRGIGTRQHNYAVKYIKNVYKQMQLRPVSQELTTCKDGLHLHIITSELIFGLSVFFFILNKPLISLGIYVFNILYHFNRTFFLKLLAKVFPVHAENIYCTVNQFDSTRPTVVVMGHYDTARTTNFIVHFAKVFAWIFRMMFQKHKYQKDLGLKMPNFLQSQYIINNLTYILFPVFLLLINFETIRIAFSSICFLTVFLSLYYTIAGLRTPYVNGAFDNGTGATMVMALAKYFSQNQLLNINLVALNTDSEENYLRGIHFFLKETKLNKDKTYFINFDGVGSDVLVAAYSEADDIGINKFYDKKAIRFFRNFFENEKKTYKDFWEGHLPFASDMTDVVSQGFKAITTFFSVEKDGFPDQYHQMTDTIDLVNFKTLDMCEEMARKLIQAIDKEQLQITD